MSLALILLLYTGVWPTPANLRALSLHPVPPSKSLPPHPRSFCAFFFIVQYPCTYNLTISHTIGYCVIDF